MVMTDAKDTRSARPITTPVLVAVAMAVSGGHPGIAGGASATVLNSAEHARVPSRTVTTRESATTLLGSITEAARRMQGQPPVIFHQQLCAIHRGQVCTTRPATPPGALRPPGISIVLQQIDLPPPLSAL